MKYCIYNTTTQRFVREDDHTTVATFNTPEDAAIGLRQIEELSKLNPNHKDDQFIISIYEW